MQTTRGIPLRSVWLYVQAAVIGLFGGLLGAGFRKGTDQLQALVMGPQGPVDVRLPLWQCVLIPTVGAALAGITLQLVRERRGPFGIGDVLELVAARRGRIRPLDSLVQILSSGCSIASGGSIGREGANSQFGATIGSLLAHLIPNSPRSRSVLLGCGIAAGMACAYKAPIAAAIFVMEVVLGNFAIDVLAPLIVSSVVSTLVMLQFFERSPLYEMGVDLAMTEWPLVLSASLLGACCGPGGLLFRYTLTAGRTLFERVRITLPLRMAIGGLIVGLIGIQYPETWGNGQNTIEAIAGTTADPSLSLMVALLFWKLVATSSTAGSGALGGVFTPNLVVGAAFGGAFGQLVDHLAGGDHRTQFALVGMAGMCAATTHAPITAMLLIFEMTGDYGLILPLMLCSILGSMSARLLDRDSIYTARLRARGHDVDAGLEALAMKTTYVRDVMRHGTAAVRDTTPLDEVLERFRATRHDALYVVDGSGHLTGYIEIHDVKQFLHEQNLGPVLIAADCTRHTPVAHPDESLATVVPRFEGQESDELPVVDSDGEHGLLLGRLTRKDVVASLSEEVLGTRSMRAKLDTGGRTRAVELPPEAAIVRLPVPDAFRGRSLDSLELPANDGISVLVVIERDALGVETRRLPRGTTVFQKDSDMVVIGERDAIEAFRGLHGIEEASPERA
ncbi:MAG: chloride channel protein [Planctomycetes bacterium]|nr:chloride channel protein [Planctomycetota bacterium]